MNKIILIIGLLLITNTAYSQLTPIIEDGKMGYIDSRGNVVVEPQYVPELSLSSKNVNGRIIRTFQVPQWSLFSEGVATVRVPLKFLNWFTYDYSYYLIDTLGKEIFDSENIIIGQMHDGIAVCRTQMKTLYTVYQEDFGYIDRSGNMCIIDKYQYASQFNSGRALVLEDSTFSYINLKGFPQPIPFKIEDGKVFSEGLAAVRNNEKWGYIDTNGYLSIKNTFTHAGKFINGLACVSDGIKYFFIDKSGEKLSPGYLNASDFSNGVAWVQKTGSENEKKWTLIDAHFKELFTLELQTVNPFVNGLSCVCFNGSFGYINLKGEFVIPSKYDYAVSFASGVATVWLDKQVLLIDETGKVIYDATESYRDIFNSFDAKIKDYNTIYNPDKN